jgi:predicted small lipoprotein YifL
MARRLVIVAMMLLMALALAAGCGVKSPPLPRTQVAPEQVRDLKVEPVPSGVQVIFTVPQVDKPGRAVTEARLYYGYLPLTGLADCPPCPPKLKKYHEFYLKGKHEQLMEGGRFSYIDKNAPLGKEALYQVVLIDSWGRKSTPSNLARTPRVQPAPAPAGLKVVPGDKVVQLSWQGAKVDVQKLSESKAVDVLAGYALFRKGPDGVLQINTSPLLTPTFKDSSVDNGKVYAYQVAQVRKIKGRNVIGARSQWVEARPKDQTPPGAPSGLDGAPAKEGLYLRFTPSPSQDTAGYMVFRKDKKGGDWKKITPSPIRENTFIDVEVTPRAVYIYKVQAIDESGNLSNFSEEMEIEYVP